MNKYWKMSVVVYLITVIFMIYAGKYLMHTVYADGAAIISLVMLIIGAVLAGKSDVVEMDMDTLDELEAMILQRKAALINGGKEDETGSF